MNTDILNKKFIPRRVLKPIGMKKSYTENLVVIATSERDNFC